MLISRGLVIICSKYNLFQVLQQSQSYRTLKLDVNRVACTNEYIGQTSIKHQTTMYLLRTVGPPRRTKAIFSSFLLSTSNCADISSNLHKQAIFQVRPSPISMVIKRAVHVFIGCVAYSDWSVAGISRDRSSLERSDWSTCPRELQLPLCICGLCESTFDQ